MASLNNDADTQATLTLIAAMEIPANEIMEKLEAGSPLVAPCFMLYIYGEDDMMAKRSVQNLWDSGEALKSNKEILSIWPSLFKESMELELRPWHGATCTIKKKDSVTFTVVIESGAEAAYIASKGMIIKGLNRSKSRRLRTQGAKVAPEMQSTFDITSDMEKVLRQAFRNSGWLFIVPHTEEWSPGVLAITHMKSG